MNLAATAHVLNWVQVQQCTSVWESAAASFFFCRPPSSRHTKGSTVASVVDHCSYICVAAVHGGWCQIATLHPQASAITNSWCLVPLVRCRILRFDLGIYNSFVQMLHTLMLMLAEKGGEAILLFSSRIRVTKVLICKAQEPK